MGVDLNKNDIRSIIFDCDGVIVDSFKFHQKKILEFADVNLTDEEYKSLHDGDNFYGKENKVKDIQWEKYWTFTHDDYIKLRINDIVKEDLMVLGEEYDLYVVSANGENNVIGLLESNDLMGIFKGVVGGVKGKSKKDLFNILFDKFNVEEKESIFVTDTLGDLIEANKINLKSIGVDYGYHAKDRLMKGTPVKVVSSFSALISIFI